jgi:hypothetical protein
MATALLRFIVFLAENEEDLVPNVLSRAMVMVKAGVTTWADVTRMLSPQLPEDVMILGYNNPGQFALKDKMALTELGTKPDPTPYDAATSVGIIKEYTVFVTPIYEDAFAMGDYVTIRLVASDMPAYTPTLWVKSNATAPKIWQYIDTLIPNVHKLILKTKSGVEPTVARGEAVSFGALQELPPPKIVYAVVIPEVEVKVTTVRYSLGGRRLGSRSRSRSRSRSKRTRSKSGAKRRRSGSRRGRAGRAGRR